MIAVEEIAAAHERARIETGWAAWSWASVAAAAVVAGLALFVARSLHSPLGARLLALGCGVWLGGQVVEAVRPDRALLDGLATGVAEAIGAGVALVGAVKVAQAEVRAPSDTRHDGIWSVAGDILDGVDVRRSAIFVAVVMAVLGVLGLLVHEIGSGLSAFNMNKERTVPAFASGFLLFGAACVTYAMGRVDESEATRAFWWTGLAAVFAFLGLDEIIAGHEELQWHTGVYGQLFLAPIVAFGAAAWIVVLRRLLPQRRAALLLLAGAVAWVTSQAIDYVHGPERAEGVPVLIVLEELAELAGSACFGFAVLVGLQARGRRRHTSDSAARSTPRP